MHLSDVAQIHKIRSLMTIKSYSAKVSRKRCRHKQERKINYCEGDNSMLQKKDNNKIQRRVNRALKMKK